jgi:hypothetical protein
MAKTETVKTFQKKVMRIFLAFVASAFTVPFITYDTGVRCITAPCPGAADRGSLVEFFAKAQDLNAYIIDYTLFITAFVGIYILIEVINKFAQQ